MPEILSQLEGLRTKVNELKSVLKIEDKQNQLKSLTVETEAKDFWQDNQRAAWINKQLADLNEDINSWQELADKVEELLEFSQVVKEDDERLINEVKDKFKELKQQYKSFEFLTLFSGKHDKKSAILTIYAGAGGDEAQDWAAMLLRMYLRMAEQKGWKTSILDASRGSEAGYKSVVLEIKGKYVYGYLQGEAGVHRLVRLSPFNADHARHTSFAMVDVLPEFEDEEMEVAIKDDDLRIDTFRASGKGGQSVNKTDSAVRIVHLPTNITVVCQNERSQAQNKEMAMKYLRSKLQRLQELEREEEKKKLRGELTEAAWGNQIRSYVLHPYKLVKDHRSEYEEPDPDKVLSGSLDGFINEYLKYKRKNE